MTDDELLSTLPVEIWTESDMGQRLLQLSREGHCTYTRMNSTLGRFEIASNIGRVGEVCDDGKIYRGPSEPNGYSVGTKRDALKRFMQIMSPPARDAANCDCEPWPGKCPYCGKEGFDVSDVRP